MKLYAPDYYKRFSCIGGDCPSNCCIGWEISIDDLTLARYDTLGQDLGESIRNSISSEGGYHHFVLNEGGRCPHLCDDNLCRIIRECGEGMLCEICREHPRFYTPTPDVCLMGVGLACPVAAELILGSAEHALYEVGETEVSAPSDYAESYRLCLTFLDTVFHVAKRGSLKGLVAYLDYHSSVTLNDELFRLSVHPNSRTELDRSRLLGQAVSATHEVDADLELELVKEIFSGFEVLDEGYADRLVFALENALADKNMISDYIADNAEKFVRLTEYFLYRHIFGAVDDGSIRERTYFAIISAFIILALSLCDGGRESIASVAADYSRNVEYSDSNLDDFIYAMEFSETAGIGFIKKILSKQDD